MTSPTAEAVAPVASAAVPQARIPGWTEYVGIAAFFALCIALSAKVFQAVSHGSGALVLTMAAVGFVGADFISGLVHWTFDTWGSDTTPLVGKTFIVPFRTHHSDPIDITRHGFVATNGHNCLAALPVLFGCLFLPMDRAWGIGLLTVLMAISLGTFGTNQFHKWAHEKSVGPVVGFLQRSHVILNPRHHDIHHTRPYDQHYCITTGWMNPVLRSVRFFRVAEWAITKVTGGIARKDDLKSA